MAVSIQKATCCIAALLAFTILAGCRRAPTPAPAGRTQLYEKLNSMGLRVTAETMKGTPVPLAQLDAELGAAEFTIPVAELVAFLRSDPMTEHLVNANMARLHRGFCWSQGQIGKRNTTFPDPEWNADPEFAACSIHVYCWGDPGLTEISSRADMITSECFLVQDGIVLASTSIRREPRPK